MFVQIRGAKVQKKSNIYKYYSSFCPKSCIFAKFVVPSRAPTRHSRPTSKELSHFRANDNLFDKKLRLCKHRQYFFAQNLAYLQNL